MKSWYPVATTQILGTYANRIADCTKMLAAMATLVKIVRALREQPHADL